MSTDTLTILIPVRNGAEWLADGLAALRASEDCSCVDVRVLSNGSVDATCDIARQAKSQFESKGWTLEVDEWGPIGKVEALRRAMDSVPSDSPVLMLDSRVRVHTRTLRLLLDAIPGKDVVSGHLRYPEVGDAVVRAFSRAYGASPYARTADLKGSCVLFSPDVHHIVRTSPNVAAEDRYYLAAVPRARRGRVDGAFVDYYFAPTAIELVRQQRRWVSSNRYADRLLGDYERNEHEARHEPHFVDPKPALVDRLVYFGVLGLAEVYGRLAPVRQSLW